MYVPPLFKEDEVPILHEAIRRTGLATLVTYGADGMEASHVPLLLDPDPAPYGTLLGHIARSNPQWQRVDASIPALAMFLGPEAYISPGWYATKKTTGKVVPTWNYVAIHAYGTIEYHHDKVRLLDIVRRLTERHEAERPAPWAVTDAPTDYLDGMLGAIVGFALPIDRLEGKWKMSQNQPAENRTGVIAGLKDKGEDAVADLVAERNRR
jgi:transcriptional regulator